MAANNKITIKFQGTGHKKLRNEINSIAQAQERLNGKVGDGVNAGNGALKNNRLLGGSFATMRSHLLLFNFAMGLGVAQLVNFAKQAAKVESMERAFNTMSGGAENATMAMKKLKQATNGTMSQFNLFQQANNAMVLGITKNSDEMAEMFDIAQRLGNALGVDTKRAVESLVTGIGRQSRLMLDNIGIVVRTDLAYAAMATQLNTTVDALSDADKKQAFLNATMEAARFKVSGLGKEVLGSQSSFDRLGASLSDATVAMGQNMGIVVKLADAMSFLIDKTVEYKGHITDTGFLLGTNETKIAILITGLLNLKDAQSQVVQQELVIIKTHDMLIEQKEEMIQAIKDEQAILDVPSVLIDRSKEEQTALTAKSDFIREMIDANIARRAEEDAQEEMFLQRKLARIAAEGEALMAMQPLKFELDNQELSRSNMLARAKDQVFEMEQRGFIESGEVYSEYQKKVKVIDAVILKSKLRSTSGMVTAFANMNTAMDGSAKASARLSQISASIDMYAGANKAFAQGGTMGFITGAAIIAQGLANIAQISKSIGDFEDGGLVGGRRHSQGGTIIEAEQGEFVMSRNAVESVGLEAMNRINAGGGGGSVNISFAGNVMSQDFIEDEAIPMIKEAIRRGADIGVA